MELKQLYQVNEYPEIEKAWNGWNDNWTKIYPTFKFIYETGGKNMLSEKYKKTKLTENEKLAYDLGATDEDGILTEKGINLLATILLEDKDIADKFYKALKKIDEEDE